MADPAQRRPNSSFERYAAFITENPTWPSIVTLRRKAEATAWQDKADNTRVRAFLTQLPPLSAKGRFALARALLAQGDRKGAETLVRETWRTDGFTQDVERQAQDAFGEFITHADDKARMDRRLYEKDDTEAGLRAAERLGGNEPAIAKARIAMLAKGGNKALLEAVPAAARNDIGYKFARLQMLRRGDQAHRSGGAAPHAAEDARSEPRSRRMVGRAPPAGAQAARRRRSEGRLRGGARRDAAEPTRDNYRAEHHFTAGWIALRFLHDANAAYAHFSKNLTGQRQPDFAGARRLLDGPRGRGDEADPGGPPALPGGGALSDRLLRPDRARQGRPRRACAQRHSRR